MPAAPTIEPLATPASHQSSLGISTTFPGQAHNRVMEGTFSGAAVPRNETFLSAMIEDLDSGFEDSPPRMTMSDADNGARCMPSGMFSATASTDDSNSPDTLSSSDDEHLQRAIKLSLNDTSLITGLSKNLVGHTAQGSTRPPNHHHKCSGVHKDGLAIRAPESTNHIDAVARTSTEKHTWLEENYSMVEDLEDQATRRLDSRSAKSRPTCNIRRKRSIRTASGSEELLVTSRSKISRCRR
jgi:hypothetical protein